MLQRKGRPATAEETREPGADVVGDDHQHSAGLECAKDVPQHGSGIRQVIQDVDHHRGRDRTRRHVRGRRHRTEDRGIAARESSLELRMRASIGLGQPQAIELSCVGAGLREQADVGADLEQPARHAAVPPQDLQIARLRACPRAERNIGHVLGLPLVEVPQLLGAVVERAVVRAAFPTFQIGEENPMRHVAGEKVSVSARMEGLRREGRSKPRRPPPRSALRSKGRRSFAHRKKS